MAACLIASADDAPMHLTPGPNRSAFAGRRHHFAAPGRAAGERPTLWLMPAGKQSADGRT